MAAEPNRYICSGCNGEFASYLNLRSHVGTCPGVKAEKIKPEPEPEPEGRVDCPYCARDFGNRPLMLAHVSACAAEKFEKTMTSPGVVRRETSRLEHVLAFEAWCSEHGR